MGTMEYISCDDPYDLDKPSKHQNHFCNNCHNLAISPRQQYTALDKPRTQNYFQSLDNHRTQNYFQSLNNPGERNYFQNLDNPSSESTYIFMDNPMCQALVPTPVNTAVLKPWIIPAP